MLVQPTSQWRGTVGTVFRTPADFASYMAGLKFGGGNWTPSGVMIHNTAAPDGKQWAATTSSDDPEVDGRQRLLNLTSYYQSLGWLGGPHLFVDATRAFEFNPLTQRGTHCSCVNGTHVGIEMVGDFDVESFSTGRGAQVRDLTVGIAAVIMSQLGMNPDQLLFHADCRQDNHACPGRNVVKGEMIARVKAAMAGGDVTSHVVVPPAAATVAGGFTYDHGAAQQLQAALNGLGITNDSGKPIGVDGWLGSETKAALSTLMGRIGGLT